ncbi:unnamed protein product [Ixodes hexagonus]
MPSRLTFRSQGAGATSAEQSLHVTSGTLCSGSGREEVHPVAPSPRRLQQLRWLLIKMDRIEISYHPDLLQLTMGPSPLAACAFQKLQTLFPKVKVREYRACMVPLHLGTF